MADLLRDAADLAKRAAALARVPDGGDAEQRRAALLQVWRTLCPIQPVPGRWSSLHGQEQALEKLRRAGEDAGVALGKVVPRVVGELCQLGSTGRLILTSDLASVGATVLNSYAMPNRFFWCDIDAVPAGHPLRDLRPEELVKLELSDRGVMLGLVRELNSHEMIAAELQHVNRQKVPDVFELDGQLGALSLTRQIAAHQRRDERLEAEKKALLEQQKEKAEKEKLWTNPSYRSFRLQELAQQMERLLAQPAQSADAMKMAALQAELADLRQRQAAQGDPR